VEPTCDHSKVIADVPEELEKHKAIAARASRASRVEAGKVRSGGAAT
jgi:hypothetical protein